MSAREWPEPPGEALPTARGRGAKKRGGGRARVHRRPIDPEGEAPQAPAAPAGFAASESGIVDSEKWPIVPVIWWQPDLRLTLPESSGLRNERVHKIPVAGFLDTAGQLAGFAGAPVHPGAPLKPEFHGNFPASDLTVLGWDRLAVPGDGNRNGHAVNGSTR